LAVSIEDFGAIADWNGTSGTDNSPAVQMAINSGARTIYVPPKPFRLSTSIVLGDGQQLVGERGSLYTSSRSLPQSLLALRTDARRIAAIRNAPGTRGQGLHGVTLELDDPTHHGVQFSGSYGNVIDNLTFFGTFDVGVVLNDTYVCKVQDVVVCGCRVRRAIVYVGASNAVTITQLHTSAFPYDPDVCMRAIAIHGGGRGYTIQSPVLQGATIGLHVHPGVVSLDARDIYTENTVCGVRLGEGTEGPHAITLQGVFGAPYKDHPQAAIAGPNIWYEAGHAVRILPSRFDSPPDAGSRNGPWPILCGPGAGSLAIDPQSVFQSNEGAMLFRQNESVRPSLEGTARLTAGGPVIARGVSSVLASPMPAPSEVLV